MAIHRLILAFVVTFSVHAEASEPTSTTCLSTQDGTFREFNLDVHSGGVMSSYGKFSAFSRTGLEWSGFLFEQPVINGRSTYQGRSENTGGAPVEFLILVDGTQSALFARDITVMGPTAWRRQNVTCFP